MPAPLAPPGRAPEMQGPPRPRATPPPRPGPPAAPGSSEERLPARCATPRGPHAASVTEQESAAWQCEIFGRWGTSCSMRQPLGQAPDLHQEGVAAPPLQQPHQQAAASVASPKLRECQQLQAGRQACLQAAGAGALERSAAWHPAGRPAQPGCPRLDGARRAAGHERPADGGVGPGEQHCQHGGVHSQVRPAEQQGGQRCARMEHTHWHSKTS